jgi:hypothetical protein
MVGLKGHRLASLTKIGDSNPVSRILGALHWRLDVGQRDSAPALTGSLEPFEKLDSFPVRISAPALTGSLEPFEKLDSFPVRITSTPLFSRLSQWNAAEAESR